MKNKKLKLNVEIVYNTCTVCETEIKDLFLCDKCKQLVEMELKDVKK